MVVYTLTDKCNLNCSFCSNVDFKTYFEPPDYKPHTLLELQRWFAKVPKDEGNITLTGGEPTLREDLFDILDFLKTSFPAATITLLSNGRRFSYPGYAQRFRIYPQLELEVPLHSHLPHVHDGLTGVQGSHAQALCGIKNALRELSKVSMRVILTKQNVPSLADFMQATARELPGLHRVIFIGLRLKGQAAQHADALSVRYADLKAQLASAADIIADAGIGLQFLHLPLCVLPRKHWQSTLRNPYRKEAMACRQCAVVERCPGILDCYLERHGEEEFRPL